MPAPKTYPDEKVVNLMDPVPHRYIFVPAGNAYITANCRKRAHAEGRPVYVVRDAQRRRMGLRVPHYVYEAVLARHEGTRGTRALATAKRDARLEGRFREALFERFPCMPDEKSEACVRWTMQKGMGRVGRKGRLGWDERATNAVFAYVRHCCTGYDAYLRAGVARDEARALVSGMVESMVRAWGFTETKKRDSGPSSSSGAGSGSGKLNDGRKTKISTGRVLRARDAGVSKHHGGKKMVSTKQSSISSARKKRIAQLVETCKRKQEDRRERISGHGRHPPHGNEWSSGGAVRNISEPPISNVPWIDDTADLDYEDGTDGEYELDSITESASSGQNSDWTGDSDDADGIDGDGDGELRDNK